MLSSPPVHVKDVDAFGMNVINRYFITVADQNYPITRKEFYRISTWNGREELAINPGQPLTNDSEDVIDTVSWEGYTEYDEDDIPPTPGQIVTTDIEEIGVDTVVRYYMVINKRRYDIGPEGLR